MTSNPTGTVIFLFTDIESSTKLSREYPKIREPARRVIIRGCVKQFS